MADDRARSVTPVQWLAMACLLHSTALGAAWWHASSRMLLNGHSGGRELALGRLAGLLAGSGVLHQLILVSRLPGLEPSVGSDRMYRWHRRTGFTLGSLFLAHPALVTVGYARWYQLSVTRQFMEFAADWPTRLAIAALFVIALMVASSTPLIRRRLTYETWHVSHLAMYVALGLASWHQANGAEIAGQPWWADYWIGLHLTVFGLLVVFRAGRPISGERGLPHSSIPTSRNSSRVDASLRVDLRDGRRARQRRKFRVALSGIVLRRLRSI